MAITRNTIEKSPEQVTGVRRRTSSADPIKRAMKLDTAKEEYRKSGDIKAFTETSEKIKSKTLGGGTERFNIEKTQGNIKEQEFGRTVSEAQQAYDFNPSEETAAGVTSALEAGYNIYGESSETGLNIQQALRNMSVSELDRALADLEFNWQNDPEANKDAYAAGLQEQIDFYGADSFEGVVLRGKLRGVEEESLLNSVRNAQLAYDEDPSNFQAYFDAQGALADFYGSSEDGYYAKLALNKVSDDEQDRMDNEISAKFEAGEVGYEGYLSYMKANMSKFAEGSDQYMKYYSASKQLSFDHTMDELLRLQFSKPKGEVMKAMQNTQKQFAEGSTAYQELQTQIDTLESEIRYDAYQEMIKGVVQERNEEINALEVKLYTAEQDYLNGDMSESKYKKKYKNYSNKIDYLSDPNTLPEFEIWQTY